PYMEPDGKHEAEPGQPEERRENTLHHPRVYSKEPNDRAAHGPPIQEVARWTWTDQRVRGGGRCRSELDRTFAAFNSKLPLDDGRQCQMLGPPGPIPYGRNNLMKTKRPGHHTDGHAQCEHGCELCSRAGKVVPASRVQV